MQGTLTFDFNFFKMNFKDIDELKCNIQDFIQMNYIPGKVTTWMIRFVATKDEPA